MRMRSILSVFRVRQSDARVQDNLAAKIKSTYGFFGDFKTWDEAEAEASTYDTKEIAGRVAALLPQYLDGSRALGVVDERFQQFHSAVSSVAARMNSRSLKVLDVGGGNGAYYLMCHRLSPDLQSVWTILETENMVAACRPLLNQVQWVTSLPDEKFDLTIISGALHCLPDPYGFLRDVCRRSNWVAIHRVPLTSSSEDSVTVQRVDPAIHPGSFRIWKLSRQRFDAVVSECGSVEYTWLVGRDFGGFPEETSVEGVLIRCS